MKLFYKILILLLVGFLFNSNTLALSKTFPVSRCGHRATFNALEQKIKNQKEEVKLKIQEKQASIAAKLAEKKKQNIIKYFNQMSSRLSQAIEKLNQLIIRIESRLVKIKKEDPNLKTQNIEEWIMEAKDKLDASNTALITAQDGLLVILETDDPKAAFMDVKNLIAEIKTQLVEVHRILVFLIGEIKGLRVGQTNTVIPTNQPQITPSPNLDESPIPNPSLAPKISPEASSL